MEQKTLKALSLCPLFRGISLGQLEATIDSVGYKILKFDKKDIYILAGMPYRHADIVIEGEMVARMVSLSGKSVEVSRLKQGDIVAPAFIFAKDNLMPVSVETEKALSDIDVFLTKKMRILSLFTVREKVSYFIKEAAGKQGSNVVQLDKSRQEIAESFGIQKFSLLRTMSELSDLGAIKVEGKKITILDRSKL